MLERGVLDIVATTGQGAHGCRGIGWRRAGDPEQLARQVARSFMDSCEPAEIEPGDLRSVTLAELTDTIIGDDYHLQTVSERAPAHAVAPGHRDALRPPRRDRGAHAGHQLAEQRIASDEYWRAALRHRRADRHTWRDRVVRLGATRPHVALAGRARHDRDVARRHAVERLLVDRQRDRVARAVAAHP